MEKAFALRSSIPEIMTNGKIAVYSTLDRRVSHLVVIDPSFNWDNRAKHEVFRCSKCRAFILPDDKSKTKDGVKFHRDCKLVKKEIEKEVANDVRGD